MPLFDRVADLELTVERYELEPLKRENAPGRTVVRLLGAGEEGLGEDVTYEKQTTGEPLELAGSTTLRSFSERLPELPGYRRWAFEGAALDLALRQNDLSLAAAVGRKARPVRFVVSQRAVEDWLALYPGLRLKLDARDSWTDELVAELAATGAVDIVDLKGLYDGDWVDATPSAELYGRVAEAFPDAWLEDPRLNDETGPALEPHRRRITWDFPIPKPAAAVAQCSDRKDNDGDGIIDSKLDPGCTSPRDVRESSPFSCWIKSAFTGGRLALSGSCSGPFSGVEFRLLDGVQLNGRWDIKYAPFCDSPKAAKPTEVRCKKTKDGAQNPNHLIDARFTTTSKDPLQRVELRFFDIRNRGIGRFVVPPTVPQTP